MEQSGERIISLLLFLFYWGSCSLSVPAKSNGFSWKSLSYLSGSSAGDAESLGGGNRRDRTDRVKIPTYRNSEFIHLKKKKGGGSYHRAGNGPTIWSSVMQIECKKKLVLSNKEAASARKREKKRFAEFWRWQTGLISEAWRNKIVERLFGFGLAHRF